MIEQYHNNKQTLTKTKLIYKFDPLNPTNFHKYVDGIKNVLVIAETQNTIIGGYYSGSFDEKEPSGSQSFLFSLKEK